ncbi:hypothetical protein RRG08_066769 [Elysia crispata]|uniref:Uncharacterized protein n=1 Tax=Elysia crispata TaxID=231223 RepID=A0AAE0XPS9_9GAST|nr:hypothetical protein RRG08_066769 [Elysia crispata]
MTYKVSVWKRAHPCLHVDNYEALPVHAQYCSQPVQSDQVKCWPGAQTATLSNTALGDPLTCGKLDESHRALFLVAGYLDFF